jgi:hypothetical protein
VETPQQAEALNTPPPPSSPPPRLAPPVLYEAADDSPTGLIVGMVAGAGAVALGVVGAVLWHKKKTMDAMVGQLNSMDDSALAIEAPPAFREPLALDPPDADEPAEP